MQAYYDEELVPSEIKDNYYEVKFYGNNFNCFIFNKKFNEFVTEKLQDLNELKNKIKVMGCNGIIISGGEPLLQRQALINLFDFCKRNKIKTAIRTNATKSKVLESLLKRNLIDLIIVNIITGKQDFQKLTKAGTFFESADQIYSELLNSLKVLKKYDQEIEIIFRTNVVPGYVFRKEVFLEIAELIKDINCSWELIKFNSEINKLLKNVNPVTDNFLENLKNIIKDKYSNLMITTF